MQAYRADDAILDAYMPQSSIMHTAEHVRSARECRPCTRDDESQLSQCRTSSTDSKSLSICSFFNTRDHKDERKTVSTFVSIESGQHTVDGDAQPERGTHVSSTLYFYKSKLQVETHWGILNMD